MKRVFKYDAPVDDRLTIAMPAGAEVLTVQLQGDGPKVWALVDDAAPLVPRVFYWRGPGHTAEVVGRYVGTVQIRNGSLVFHLFEEQR
jgi:hypothetical protein